MTAAQKREARMKLVTEARQILDAAGKEKRALTSEEDAKWNRIDADIIKLTSEIKSDEEFEQRTNRLARYEEEDRASQGRKTESDKPGDRPGDGATEARNKPIELEFRGQKIRFEPGSNEHRRAQAEYRERFNNWLAGRERRDLQTDLDVAGGYTQAPEQMVMELLKDVDNEVLVRQRARKFTTNAATLGAVRRTSKLSSFSWGGELSPPNKDTSLKFGKRSLSPHYMTGEILVSRDLLRNSMMNPEAIVREELARDAGELEEQAFMTGDGVQKPLGIFTASADGISTGRDVATGNTSTAITFDGLIEAKFSLKPKYRKTAEWMFHRDAVKQVRKIKDTTNQYIWEPSVKVGEPDTILELPYLESEWVPNTFTSGLYVGALCNWFYYWIVDNLTMDMQRLVEKYAETNQDAFLVRRKMDAAPMLEEAFTRVKLG